MLRTAMMIFGFTQAVKVKVKHYLNSRAILHFTYALKLKLKTMLSAA